MIKLYNKPLACSMAVHIALREVDLPFELVPVTSEGAGKSAGGEDYYAVHPLGAVPALRLDDGAVLTETAVMLEYLALTKPEIGLVPAPGSPEYWDFRQLMNFIATDIHKNYGPLFFPATSDEMKEAWIKRLVKRLDHLSGRLEGHPYLLDQGYSVADIYLFVMLYWASYVDVDIRQWPRLAEYYDRLIGRDAISKAVEVERP